MHIEESFICGKHTAADCEDGIVCTPNFVAVIDGSTSKTPFRLDPTMKNGRFAMLLIRNYIRQMAAEATLEEFCQGITSRIAEEYAERGIYERMAAHPEERLTASAIVYSEHRKEVWMVGDCQAIVDGVFYENPKPCEQETAMQRADMIKGGMTPADARHRAADNKGNARRPEPPVCRNRRHDDIHARHTTRQRTQLRRACLRRLPHSAAHASRHRKGADKTTRRRPAEHPQLCGYERSR